MLISAFSTNESSSNVSQLFPLIHTMQMFLWTTLLSVLMIQRSAGRMLVEECGFPIVGPRIINGKDAERDAGSWMAAIRNTYQFLCGGTVIHKRFVLTAAHCIDGQEKLFVALGSYNKSNPAQEYSVRLAVMHEEYNRTTMKHDIGLLQPSQDIQFGFIYPICISLNPLKKRRVNTMPEFDAYGWGITETDSESQILQKTTIYRRNRSICNKYYPNNPLTSNQLCVGSPEGDTCRGDSGGPLIEPFSSEEPRIQLALVSYGTIRCDGDGIYTDVSSYASWIEWNINRYQSRDRLQRHRPRPPLHAGSRNRERFDANPTSFGPTSRQSMFLYDECGGNDISKNLLVTIYGAETGKGVMITDRYVLTNAKDLPLNPASLEVLTNEGDYSDEMKVESIFKHPEFSGDLNHDIALLRLTKPAVFSGGMKPICMLLQARNTRLPPRSPTLTTFDYQASRAIPITASECANRINGELKHDQLCIEKPNMESEYVFTGDILSKTVEYKRKVRHILFGIVSFSSNGLLILTNVMKYSNWIADIVMNE